MKPVQTPNSSGGFTRSYETLVTVWAEASRTRRDFETYVRAIRGVTNDTQFESHEFTVRYSSVKHLGTQFSSAFSEAFETISDINSVKSDYFLFLERGSAGTAKGKLFKVEKFRLDEQRQELMTMRAQEVEEQGVGWPA